MAIKNIFLNCWHTMGIQLWKVQAMITGSWYLICVYSLTFLSLKCRNDIQATSLALTDPERQNHSRTTQNSSCKQTSDLHTRQKWLQLCFSLLFSFIFCCHARMAFVLWHFSSCDTRANISSVKQYQIFLHSFLWCVHLFLCVSRADGSAQASHWSVWGGQMKERHYHKVGVFKTDAAQETM